jgi:hypothetical protein
VVKDQIVVLPALLVAVDETSMYFPTLSPYISEIEEYLFPESMSEYPRVPSHVQPAGSVVGAVDIWASHIYQLKDVEVSLVP